MCLIFDKVHFWLARRWGGDRGSGDLVIDLFFGLLDENIDDGLLFVGLLGSDVLGWRWWWWWSWGLDEDDLVVFLGLNELVHLGLLDLFVFGLWWWDVDVDGLLDDGGKGLWSCNTTQERSLI